MTDLTNLLPEYSYGDVLTTTNSGQGFTNVLKNLQDGLGNNSTVLIANNAIQFLYGGGNSLYLNGTELLSSGNNINKSTQDNPIFQGTGALTVPIGDTSQRPSSPTNGMMRYNSQTTNFEFYENGSWVGSAGVATITGTTNQIVVTGTTDAVISLASNIQGISSLKTANIGIDLALVGAGTITTNSAIPLILKPNSNSAVQIGADNSANNVEIKGGSELRLYSAAGATYSGWKVSAGPNTVLTMPQGAGSAQQVFMSNGDSTTRWGDMAVSTVTRFVSQTAHGLTQGDMVKVNQSTGAYEKAKADSAANAEVVGMVNYISANSFDLVVAGICTPGNVLEVGKAYFLDTVTAGDYSTVDPLNPAQPTKISKFLFVAITTSDAVWVNQRGIAVK